MATRVDGYLLLERAIALLKTIKHPNILPIFEAINNPYKNKIYLIYDYIENGSLPKKISEE